MASNLFFPVTRGINWQFHRIPEDSVQVYEAASMKRVRAQYSQYPRWKFQLNWEALLDNPTNIPQPLINPYTDLEAVVGFFLDMGSFQSFLLDVSQLTRQRKDAHIDGQVLGTGDGATTIFQLVHQYGGGLEIIQNVKNLVVRINGTPTVAYTLFNTGIIQFTSAPPLNAYIDTDFDFYYRVCFDDSNVDASGFMYQIYQMKQINLIEDRI